MTKKARLIPLICLGSLALSACGFNTGRGFQVGVKQVGVNLAFANGSLLTTRIVHLPPVPAPSYGSFLATIGRYVGAGNGSAAGAGTKSSAGAPLVTNRFPAGPSCPKASPSARPDVPLQVYVSKAPATGLYTEHNTGKFTIIENGLPLSGTYPQQGEFSIQNVKVTQSSDAVNGTVTNLYYDLVEQGVDGSQTTTTYLAQLVNGSLPNRAQVEAGTGPGTTGQLDLVKQVTVNSQGTSTFAPSSPVEIMAMTTGVGASWNSAGVDTASGTAMEVSGKITAVDHVDLCGHLVEAYRVVSNEQVSNPRSKFASSTSTNDPNVYEIAPQFGGLFVSEHIDTTTNIPSSSSSGSVSANTTVVELNYTSTLDSVNPH